jgi:hypothetical protein
VTTSYQNIIIGRPAFRRPIDLKLPHKRKDKSFLDSQSSTLKHHDCQGKLRQALDRRSNYNNTDRDSYSESHKMTIRDPTEPLKTNIQGNNSYQGRDGDTAASRTSNAKAHSCPKADTLLNSQIQSQQAKDGHKPYVTATLKTAS